MCRYVCLDAVEGELCLLGVMEVMRCVLLCTLEAVDGGICLLEVAGRTGGHAMCAGRAGGDVLYSVCWRCLTYRR